MLKVLIVGASRGIGLEFARQYAADGWRVIATHRDPEVARKISSLGAEPVRLEVSDAASCEALASTLMPESLDLVVLSAGKFPKGDDDLIHLDEAQFNRVMTVNVLAPLRLAALMRSRLKPGATVAFLSSTMGSIGNTVTSNAVFYRASKAALNMVVKTLSIEWRADNIRTLALHPGWVRTDMGGAAADIDVVTSVNGLRKVIAEPGMDRSGHFFDYKGEAQPW